MAVLSITVKAFWLRFFSPKDPCSPLESSVHFTSYLILFSLLHEGFHGVIGRDGQLWNFSEIVLNFKKTKKKKSIWKISKQSL